MIHLKRILRRIYIRTLPLSVRQPLGRLPGIRQVRERWFHRDPTMYDEYYSADYYAYKKTMGWAEQAAKVLVPLWLAEFAPRTVIDLGCGTGEFLKTMRLCSVEVKGVDYAQAAVDQCVADGLEVRRADLTRPDSVPWQGDLVLSFEVAEHLPPEAADTFVENLCGASRQHVILTAAAPGQPGLHHFNCQPKSYWIEKMQMRGLHFDPVLTDR